MSLCLLVLQLAFRSAEHLANTLAEYWVKSPMKSTAPSLFTREETTQRGARRQI